MAEVPKKGLGGGFPKKDNRELEASNRQALLRSLATTNLAYVAPYLSLARVADKEVCPGRTVTIRVREVNILPQESYIVIRMSTSTNIDAPKSTRNIEAVLYTFRNLSSQVFEPFVYISRTSEGQEVLAYSSDEEFLVGKISGDERAVLRELKKIATEKEMRSLARFVDLMEQAVRGASQAAS